MNKSFDTIVNRLSNILPYSIRKKILKKYGIKIGDNSVIRKDVFFETERVKIGSNTFINTFCKFYTGAGNCYISIGDNVQLGGGVTILCTSHHIGDSQKRAGSPNYANVVIEDGCWIGANVTILPGVVIKAGSVIGAGSVVIESTDRNCLYAGVPAVKKRQLV